MRFLRVFKESKFGLYSSLFALLMLGDGVMSYVLPVMIEERVGNQLQMGLILSFSSMVGLICDFLFSRWLRGSRYAIITRRSLAAAMLFPIVILLFGQYIWAYLAAMAIWGIYYELAMFSNYHFVDEEISPEQQPMVWGMITSVWSLSWFIAPLLATFVFNYFVQGPLLLGLGFYVSAMGLFLILGKYLKRPPKAVNVDERTATSFEQELRVWWTLLKKLWPIYIFNLMAVLVMSGFWSVGTLLAEELGEQSSLGMLFFAAWTFPPLLFSALAGPVTARFRKKKTAFVAGLISGMLLVPFIWTRSIPVVVILTFLSSVSYSIGYPGYDAAVQEYVKKLGAVGNDLIGLQSSSASFAYILGPIIAGALASWLGNQAALGVLGLLFAVVSSIGLIVVRREINLPHQALKTILCENDV